MSGHSPKIVRVISELSIAQLRDDSSNLSVGLSDNRVQAILNSHEALRQQLTEAEARLASQGEQIAQLTKENEILLAARDVHILLLNKVSSNLAAALTARDEAERRMKWQSIETAPIEGRFLVCDDRYRVMVADGHMYSLSILPGVPSHLSGHHWVRWMPLPAPPSDPSADPPKGAQE